MRRLLLLSAVAFMVFVLAFQPVSAVTCPLGSGWCYLDVNGCNKDADNSRASVSVQAINVYWYYNPDLNRWRIEIEQVTGEGDANFRGNSHPTYGDYGVYWYLPGSYRNRERFGDQVVVYTSAIKRRFTMFDTGTIFSGTRVFQGGSRSSTARCLASGNQCPRVIVAGSVGNTGAVCSVSPPVGGPVPVWVPTSDVLPEDSSS